MSSFFLKTKNRIEKIITVLSIISTVSINVLYISYLSFALRFDIGNRNINIALLVATLLFMLLYIILRPMGQNAKNGVVITKKIYKFFRFSMKIFTLLTTVYTITSSVKALSFIGVILSVGGALLLVFRIIIDALISILGIKIRRIGRSKKQKKTEQYNENEPVELELDFGDYAVSDIKE